MQESISSITDFLRQGDFHFRFFDLGRRVKRISNSLFEKIENQQELYPYPFQQSAWLAVLFWDKNKRNEPIIWFLRFPIDELGYLQLSSRDAFMRQILDQLGQGILEQQQGKEISDSLKESPFAFKPKQDRLAVFHSKAAKILNQPASRFYLHVQEYLSGNIGYEQWEFLGLQGLADFVVRLDEDNNERQLVSALSKLPQTPFETICNLLEHIEPNRVLTESIASQLSAEKLDQLAVSKVAAMTRALSNAQPDTIRLKAWGDILSSKMASEIEVLAALSGRAWNDLKDEGLFRQFLLGLASCEQEQFNILLVDLMAIPLMREPILNVIRSPERDAQLTGKIGMFFQASRGEAS